MYIATLAIGLRDTSRIKMKLCGVNTDMNTLLLARIADATGLNVYAKTKDAAHGRNKPKSMVKLLTEIKTDENTARRFKTGDDFLKEWDRL